LEFFKLAKGYWIGSIDILDTAVYQDYVRENSVAFSKYGARFLVRGGDSLTVEGQTRSRMVVIEFDDYATALACYRSAEYARAFSIRKDVAIADIAIVEGYDGPQPAT
jgi:uncharacterized protein (DUF1330 family)